MEKQDRLAMLEDRGTPRQLAEWITRLPDGEYQVFVKKARSRDEILREFQAIFSDMDKIACSETDGMTDDESQEWINNVIEQERENNTGKH
jgi:hypothetical protein